MTLDDAREWVQSARTEAGHIIEICDLLEKLEGRDDPHRASELADELVRVAAQLNGDAVMAQRKINNPGNHAEQEQTA